LLTVNSLAKQYPEYGLLIKSGNEHLHYSLPNLVGDFMKVVIGWDHLQFMQLMAVIMNRENFSEIQIHSYKLKIFLQFCLW